MSIMNDYQLRIERWETPRNFTHYEDYIKFRRANMLSPIQQTYFSNQRNMVKEQAMSRASSAATLSISGSLSQSNLVGVTTKSAFYRRRNASEKRLILIVAILVIIAILLLTALVIITYTYLQTENDLCSSPECVQSAANLMASMDQTVNPCEDFYKFACGRWGLEHAIPDSAISHDWFTEKQSDMMRTIREYLKQKGSDSDPYPVTQARTMYDACLDLDQLESLGLQPMLAIMDRIGLNRRPPISARGAVDPSASSWMKLVVNAKRFLSKEVFVGIGVFQDSSDGTINRINVGSPDTKSPLPSGSKSMDRHIDRQRRVDSADDETTANERTYIKYISDVMTYLEQEASSKQDFTDPATKIQRFEKILWRELEADTSVDVAVLTIAELHTLAENVTTPTPTPTSWDWTSYMTLMYDDIENTTLDASNETVVVRNAQYLGKMMELLAGTPLETIQLYIWWDIVSTLTPQTNRYLRDLRHNYIQQVSGDEMAPLTRSMFCAGAVNQMMGMAVSVSISKPDFVNTTRVKVHQMLADIRSAFEDLVRGLDWMDGDTKMATMEKAKVMRSFVGFPDWLLVEGELEKEYLGVVVNGSTYLDNMADILQKSVTTMLANLRTPNAVNITDSWITVPTDVNAYYTFQTNSINVPVAILQFPFYGLGLEALNYGAIGSILGHELTHGFDNSGRQYDKDGRMRQWWTNQTVDEYVSRTACFVEQYGKYGLEGIDTKVDGKLTLGENIADNGGLREALGAYRSYVSRNGEERRLPGLQMYTNEQLFYVSFANLWCSAWTQPSLSWMLKDEHSPNPVRVKGVLANSPEFAQVWQCPKGTPMNPEPEQRCRLW